MSRWQGTAIAAILSLAACAHAPQAGAVSKPPAVLRVFLILFENEDAHEAYAQPFFRRIADEGALVPRYFGVTHPSYPNYLALTSGATWGVRSDIQTTIDGTHLGDLLEANGKSWKVYAEGFPGNCFLGKKSGKYARRHVPFLSYRNIQENPARCARVVEAAQLKEDIRSGQLADFSLYIPDNDHNGHDTGVADADRWLAHAFGPLLKDPRFTRGLLLALTFDEDNYLAKNHVYMALWGDAIEPGSIVTGRFDHYSLLRTIEELLGTGTLGRHDIQAIPFRGIWK